MSCELAQTSVPSRVGFNSNTFLVAAGTFFIAAEYRKSSFVIGSACPLARRRVGFLSLHLTLLARHRCSDVFTDRLFLLGGLTL